MRGAAFAAAVLAAAAMEVDTSSAVNTRTGLRKSGLHDPIGSVQGLITRRLGAAYVPSFQLQVIPAAPNGEDVFQLDFNQATKQVIVRGSAGYAMAAGLNWYLKYTANVSFSWGRNDSGNQVKLPEPGTLTPPANPGQTIAPVKYRYSYNVCTYGYSMPWWNFTQFEEEIDRLALWGVNLPLAFQGQEYTWDRFFRSMSSPLNESEINAWFSGPAFLPWNRMGNMQGWGGGLDPTWHAQQYTLQKAIVSRMREFGMTPVLPGFAGHVPRALQYHYPNATFTNSPDWCGFPPAYGSDTLLEATDPLFLQLGTQFNSMVLEDYGDPTGQESPVFNADMYNEMEPNSPDLDYLKACNAATYQAMVNAKGSATYMMQAWLFHEGFWTFDRVQAFLSGVPIGKMLILDLNTEEGPVWNQYDDFFGHTWIWNSLITYGGRRGIYGDLNRIASMPYADHAKASNMVGVGFTPEATEMIPSQFDVMMEAGWRSSPITDPTAWLQTWAVRRYGSTSPSIASAYATLATAAYNSPIDTASMELYPSLGESMSRNTNASGLLAALRLFVTAASNKEVDPTVGPFSYDLTDLHRQVLVNLWSDAHGVLAGRYGATAPYSNRAASVTFYVTLCQTLLSTLDTVLAADQNFLLGTWIAEAARWGDNVGRSDLTTQYVFNARNQITLWGPNGEINDYAAKNGWSGLVSSYYLPRYNFLWAGMVQAASTGQPLNQSGIDADTLAFEKAWSNQTSLRPPTTASGADPVALAAATLATWASWTPSAWTALPNTDVAVPPKSNQFVQVGQTGYAAVSDDCPYVGKSSQPTLPQCQSACISFTTCTGINYNPGVNGGDCVYRQCTDPLHPRLSPGYDGYTYYGLNMTASAVIYSAWHTDPAVLASLCAGPSSGCAGFNSAGVLYAAVNGTRPAPGVTLYVRRA